MQARQEQNNGAIFGVGGFGLCGHISRWDVLKWCHVHWEWADKAFHLRSPFSGLLLLGGCREVDATSLLEPLLPPQLQKEPLLEPLLVHAPIVQHAMRADEIWAIGLLGQFRPLDICQRPHAMQMDGVLLRSDHFGFGHSGPETTKGAGARQDQDFPGEIRWNISRIVGRQRHISVTT